MNLERERKGIDVFGVCKPGLQETFDYREGCFLRFRKEHSAGDEPPNTHCVQHLWLCGKCSEKYMLAYEDTLGVVMTLHRLDLPEERDTCRFVAVA